MTAPGWTYSKIKEFETCPKKYEGSYVTKEVKFTDTEATLYGKAGHTAAELYIRDGLEVEPKFSWLLPTLERLKEIKGEKFCELKMGIKKVDGKLEACDFYDADYWCRGIADLVVIDDSVGHVLDYKFGKSSRYADERQLALMAACMFLKFPALEKVKAALLFVVAGDMVKSEYTRDTALAIFANLHELLVRREVAYETNVFNPRPNPLCRFCQVKSCEHWEPR